MNQRGIRSIFAIAGVLAVAGPAGAQQQYFNFSFSGTNVSGSGIIGATPIGAGIFFVESVTGTANGQPLSLLPQTNPTTCPSCTGSLTSQVLVSDGWGFDDAFAPGSSNGMLDTGGFGFYIPGSGINVIYSGGQYFYGDTALQTSNPQDPYIPITLTITPVPFPPSTNNDASGLGALAAVTTGYNNNAAGDYALNSNTTGYFNNAVGYNAMFANTSGYNNNAQGGNALSSNTTGYGNSAMGANSLLKVTTGTRNVGVGNNTGTTIVAGSYNVDIGWGVSGSGDESGVVRIGNPTYATGGTYIAGITASTVTGAAVYVTPSGQLGVLASSERYKRDIATLGSEADKLARLRPVSFHLKSDPNGTLQYGLIAEEVDQVYPELVTRDEKGQIQGVRYDELAPLLLTAAQRQQQRMQAQESSLSHARDGLDAANARLDALASLVAQLRSENQELRETVRRMTRDGTRVATR